LHSPKTQFVSIKKSDNACPECASFKRGKTNNLYVDVLQARTCSGNIPWRNQTAILERWSTARARTDFTPKCITARMIVNKTIIIIISSNWALSFIYRTRSFCIVRYFFYIHYFPWTSVDILFVFIKRFRFSQFFLVTCLVLRLVS